MRHNANMETVTMTRPQGPLPTNMGKAYATAIMDMTGSQARARAARSVA